MRIKTAVKFQEEVKLKAHFYFISPISLISLSITKAPAKVCYNAIVRACHFYGMLRVFAGLAICKAHHFKLFLYSMLILYLSVIKRKNPFPLALISHEQNKYSKIKNQIQNNVFTLKALKDLQLDII